VEHEAERLMHVTRLRAAARAAAMGIGLILAGCTPAQPAEVGSVADLKVTSSAFSEGGSVPARNTCDGEDLSPPLAWSGSPSGTQSMAIVVTDPDAGGFIHWAAANVEVNPDGGGNLPEAASGSASVGVEGSNDFGRTGWRGPCPPSGEHRYVFTVYALSGTLDLSAGFDSHQLQGALSGKIVAQGQLTAKYRRAGR
jgi:Raf kinase inhibitor-like YbhB/YbcL family protein